MTTSRSTGTEEAPLTRDLIYAARYYLGNRRVLLVLAALVIAAGLALNWSWLAAAGIAPILISVLPCLAMCALGLCMNRGSGKSCSTDANPREPAAVDDAIHTSQAVSLDVPRESAAPELPISGDAAPLPNPEPQPSKERRPTDA
ncbi:MAG: hypothetical protein AB7Q76_01070 [Gammaproteobacteria bacterium]